MDTDKSTATTPADLATLAKVLGVADSADLAELPRAVKLLRLALTAGVDPSTASEAALAAVRFDPRGRPVRDSDRGTQPIGSTSGPRVQAVEDAIQLLEGADRAAGLMAVQRLAELHRTARATMDRNIAARDSAGERLRHRRQTAEGGAWYALASLAAMMAPDPVDHLHGFAVRFALNTMAADGVALAGAALADAPHWKQWRADFRGALHDAVRRLGAALGAEASQATAEETEGGAFDDSPGRALCADLDHPPDAGADTPAGRMLWADARAADLLEGLGAELGGVAAEWGAEQATALRRDAAARWARFEADPAAELPHRTTWPGDKRPTRTAAGVLWEAWAWPEPEPKTPRRPAPLTRKLAGLLWLGRFRGLAEELQADEQAHQSNPAALAVLVHAPVGDILQRARPGSDGRLISKDGEQLPLIETATLEDLEALSVLGTLTGHRVIRWLIYAGNVGHRLGVRGPVELAPGVVARRAPLGVSLEVGGGFRALAEAMGETSHSGATRVAQAIRVMASYALEWRYSGRAGGGSLLSWEQRESASPAHPRELVVMLSPVLLPMLVHKLPPSERALVPVLTLPPIPSGMFRGRGVAPAVARLDWLATRELAERRQEVAAHGGAALPWEGMAREAGLRNPKHLAQALELWTQDTEHGAARWERVGRHRWLLADRPETAPARDFILQGATDAAQAAEAGRKSARKRRRRKRSGKQGQKSDK